MKKSTKIWLWIALIICVATTIMNATMGRWPSVIVAAVAIIGLCLLLFKEMKSGFILMCCCYVVSFIIGVYGGITGDTNVAISIIMSFIGSALIPCITAIFLRGQWDRLK